MYHQMMPPTMMIPAMIHTHGKSAVVVGVACASAIVLTSMRYPTIVVTHFSYHCPVASDLQPPFDPLLEPALIAPSD